MVTSSFVTNYKEETSTVLKQTIPKENTKTLDKINYRTIILSDNLAHSFPHTISLNGRQHSARCSSILPGVGVYAF